MRPVSSRRRSAGTRTSVLSVTTCATDMDVIKITQSCGSGKSVTIESSSNAVFTTGMAPMRPICSTWESTRATIPVAGIVRISPFGRMRLISFGVKFSIPFLNVFVIDRGFFARPNSPRRTNTIPLSPVTGITFKKYTMQQFLLLLTPPCFFYRVHGLKHFTHTRSFACNAICF